MSKPGLSPVKPGPPRLRDAPGIVMYTRPLLGLALGLFAAGPLPALAHDRGELLYGTHCVACHNSQLHWRDKRQVVDWTSLRAQVRLWQATGMLAWNESDIDQVARYLNDTYYRFPMPGGLPGTGRVALGPAPAPR